MGNRKTTFLGLRMDQEWQDINIWEEFFKNFPIKTLIELGTGNGGMSMYFALQCYQIGAKFHTFDNQLWIDFDKPIPAFLNMRTAFHHVDLFEGGGQHVKEVLAVAEHPLMLFFDNGHKAREWQLFANLTEPGDYLAVHDWETEFFPADIGDVPVERILTELSDARLPGWKAMWFKRL